MEEILMRSPEVEVSFKKGKVRSFLNDLIELCSKHDLSIISDEEETVVEFYDWDYFVELEADPEGASLCWPSIQTGMVVRGKL